MNDFTNMMRFELLDHRVVCYGVVFTRADVGSGKRGKLGSLHVIRCCLIYRLLLDLLLVLLYNTFISLSFHLEILSFRERVQGVLDVHVSGVYETCCIIRIHLFVELHETEYDGVVNGFGFPVLIRLNSGDWSSERDLVDGNGAVVELAV